VQLARPERAHRTAVRPGPHQAGEPLKPLPGLVIYADIVEFSP
jgi:hypothetical protein